MNNTTETYPAQTKTEAFEVPTTQTEQVYPSYGVSYAGELVVSQVIKKPYSPDNDPVGYGV